MTHATIASIVEGHGEVQALPILLRRIANEIFDVQQLLVTPPHRVRRSQMTSGGDFLARAVRVQAARIGELGGVLVTADADDDCAIELGERLREASAPIPVQVSVAVREFESWYLAAASSLAVHRLFRPDPMYVGNPEIRRDAKGALSQLMTERYRETLHQPAFAAIMDLEQACQARSFRHLVTCMGRLLGKGDHWCN